MYEWVRRERHAHGGGGYVVCGVDAILCEIKGLRGGGVYTVCGKEGGPPVFPRVQIKFSLQFPRDCRQAAALS